MARTQQRLNRQARRAGHALAIGAALVGSMGLIAGCRGERTDKPPRQFFPDMDDQPRYRPQWESPLFADGRSQRPVVRGTVAFGRWAVDVDDPEIALSDWAGTFRDQRAALLKEDDQVFRGLAADPTGDPEDADNWLDGIPTEVTIDLIEHGQERFNIFCAACHGYAGDGQGMVGGRWSYPVPNFHDDKYLAGAGRGDEAVKTGRDGYIFHVIRNGVPDPINAGTYAYKMPPYREKVSEEDAWAIVAYIRALQASRRGEFDRLPEIERQRLNEMRGVPSAAADEDRAGDTVASAGEASEGGPR